MTALILFLLAFVALCLTVLVRNEKVYEYRSSLLNLVSSAAIDDIHRSDGSYDWQWRYQAFGEVTYGVMVYKFWKRLDSFYPDLSFADVNVKRLSQPAQ